MKTDRLEVCLGLMNSFEFLSVEFWEGVWNRKWNRVFLVETASGSFRGRNMS